MELFKKKNVELIGRMVGECRSRIGAASAGVIRGGCGTALSSLSAVPPLLGSLRTLGEGSGWAND